MEGVVRSFLSYLRVEKGVSINTHDAYRRDVEKFQEFAAKKRLRLEEATRETIVDFLRSLYQRKLESRSVARNLVTLRQFFRFALIEGIVKEDPTETVESPRFRMGLPRFLSVEEVDRLLSAPDVTTIIGLRDKAMIEVMYSAGLRVSELCGLRLSDFHFDAGYVRCMGKGSKERLVPIGRQAMEIVQRYLRDSRPKLLRENSPELLFLNRHGGRMFAARLLENGFRFRPQSRSDQAIEAAHAASQFCNASSGSRRRFARGADDARPHGHCNNTNLHARRGRTAKASLSRASSAGVIGRGPRRARAQAARRNCVAREFVNRPCKAVGLVGGSATQIYSRIGGGVSSHA